MELTNEFRVNVPLDDAWAILTDIERIAPSMPGAQLQEVEGDEYRGIVKVKVGPITAQYKGTANATVTATLTPEPDGTRVTVVTDLTITGKVAQFGRGVLADVSSKLLGQFVDNLERDVLSAGAPQGDGAATASDAGNGNAAPSSTATSAS